MAARGRLAAAAVVAVVAGCGDEPRRASDGGPTPAATAATPEGEPTATPTIDPDVERELRRPHVARLLKRCRPTQPNHSIPPGQEENPGAEFADYHGGDGLWTVLAPAGVVMADPSEVRRDGSIARKFPWWRGVDGDLEITGGRVDGSGEPLRSRIPSGYGPTGFQSTAIIFPGEGCWEVNGTAGGAQLSFVTLVVKPRA